MCTVCTANCRICQNRAYARSCFLQIGSMIVGLPLVTLQFPKSLAAWLRLRTFTQVSFEFPEMIRVEAGFAAILLLVVLLQARTCMRATALLPMCR
jgi:hypothetical protein